MRQELPIGESALRSLLRRVYEIDADLLAYRPADWSVGAYTITASGGERYFLKVQRTIPTGFAAGSYDFCLPLTRELWRRGILPHIAYPIPTIDGKLSTTHGAHVLVLNNYIDGTVLGGEGIGDLSLAELGTVLGVLHHSTAQLRFDHPHIDTYVFSFCEQFRRAFAVLEHPSPDEGPGVARMRTALLPRSDEIAAYLNHLAVLQADVRSKQLSMVICHTDVHPWNLMRDSAGHLYLIDWDNAMIAPPEHDLFAFTGDERFWQLFLPAYERHAGRVHIDPDVLRFYYYRRGLEDIADYLQRILGGDGGDTRDIGDLQGIEDCLGDLRGIEGTMVRIQEKLTCW